MNATWTELQDFKNSNADKIVTVSHILSRESQDRNSELQE